MQAQTQAERANLERARPVARRMITLGLLNNMPDEALKVTEKQFARLIHSVSEGIDVDFHMFALKKTPRSPAARAYLNARCDQTSIFDSKLDGLIITGAAPSAPLLHDEPYWQELTEIIDWAKTGTASTIFSCLAAHAGVWHLDRIERRASPEKFVGLFTFTAECEHPLVGPQGRRLLVPHSRYNGLLRSDLERAGYAILASSPEHGVDSFMKSCGSQFLFLQGHPEYDANSLAREYRRDVSRYWLGETDRTPAMPKSYFSAEAERELLALARSGRDGIQEKLSRIEALAPHRAMWREEATSFYANWIQAVAASMREGQLAY